MAPEGSMFWDGITTGDASAAPYSSDEFKQFLYGLFGSPGVFNGLTLTPTAFSFVSTAEFGQGAGLVSGTVSPVSIAAMHAFVIGNYYYNSASQTLAIPTPGANPRVDIVALEANWTTRTVRVVRVAGAEAANPTPPVLTQTNFTQWQMALASVHITTGGVITVRDMRPGYMGLSPQTMFRDTNGRVFEEAFDNFTTSVPVGAGAAGGYFTALTSGTLAAAQGESAIQMNTTATNARDARISWGVTSGGTAIRQFELSKAPVLFEARMSFAAALDAQAQFIMTMSTGAADQLKFGFIGSVSATNLVIQGNNGGPTNFTTPQAADASGAYHTYGLWVPASGGPAVALYDGIPIGHMAANLPAAATDLTASFFVANGTTAADRVLKVDWWRWVRGAN